jgi:hypothetical protein
MTPTQPPDSVVHEAVIAARRSPCSKSKRGVVIFEPDHDDWQHPPVVMVASGFNGPPGLMHCDGSDACRRDCPKICMHAEERAILQIDRDTWERFGDGGFHMQHLDLVHVKVVDGKLVGGGGPSCWQCSRTVYDALLGGVWLYQTAESLGKMPVEHVPPGAQFGGAVASFMGATSPPAEPQWVRYTAEQFHRATLALTKGGPLYAPSRH